MPLNIKDERAHELARALAKETGQTMTEAVTEAIRLRLEQVRRQGEADAMLKDILEIGRRYASTLRGKPIDHAELLYDERGLPK